jgi:hypothetical protein
MKKVFSPDEMKKIKKFLVKFHGKGTDVTTDDLCDELGLEKETLLAYTKKHKLKIQGVEKKPQKINNANKGKKNIKPLEQIQSLIKEVDRQREQGIKVSTALEQVGSLTIGEYYYYKNNKNQTKDNDTQLKQNKKPSRKTKDLAPIPTQPHVIEYVSVPNNNKGTLMVAIGSIDAVAELVARITQRN